MFGRVLLTRDAGSVPKYAHGSKFMTTADLSSAIANTPETSINHLYERQ